MKYRMRSIAIVEAYHPTPGGDLIAEIPGWFIEAIRYGLIRADDLGSYLAPTPLRKIRINEGDWIVKDEHGALSIIPNEKFVATYEALP